MAPRDSKDLRVLLVEDLEDTRLFMRLELENLGFRVFEAADGETAVRVALEEKPDVVLMDLSLPQVDGFEATKLMRQQPGMENVPIIAITAHQQDDFRSHAKASGIDAYVTKPIDINWLKELINGLLA
jgi:two-component system, cell cycle response regulator DivK